MKTLESLALKQDLLSFLYGLPQTRVLDILFFIVRNKDFTFLYLCRSFNKVNKKKVWVGVIIEF